MPAIGKPSHAASSEMFSFLAIAARIPFSVPEGRRRDAARFSGYALLLKQPVQRRRLPLRPRDALLIQLVFRPVRSRLNLGRFGRGATFKTYKTGF